MAKFESFTLDDKTLAVVKKKAEGGSTFFQSILESYEQHGSVTKNMKAAIDREIARDKEYANRPKLKDENGELGPINNQAFRDNKPICFIRGCRDLAAVRVENIGVCGDHIEEAKEQNAQYHAQRANSKPAPATA
jgi:hypothetical protein